MGSSQGPELFDVRPLQPGEAHPWAPLAERMRPRTLEEFVGQAHLLGPGRVLRRLVAGGKLPSMVLWGPPGTGKTTLARLLAAQIGATLETISAVTSGVREIREVIDRAGSRRRLAGASTLLFVDEIHRFNKGQQDALLPHVEAGTVVLVGATTENPSFEVNGALLSRVRVFALAPLGLDDLAGLLRRALTDTERGLGERKVVVEEALLRGMASLAGGDARRALGDLESCVDMLAADQCELTAELVGATLGRHPLRYDKAGEEHYNVVSAFIKSMRASDADAAVYWLVRMIEAGEDAMFIARRLVIFASEDVGNADPQALVLAQAAASATHLVGLPEAALHLTQATSYLALAPKSNSALRAYGAARRDVQRLGALPVPMVIRNAVTKMMKESGYGHGYRYPHDFSGGIDRQHQSFLPEALAGVPRGHYASVGKLGWEGAAWSRRWDAVDAPQRRGRGERSDDAERRAVAGVDRESEAGSTDEGADDRDTTDVR